jgi:CubicO group peptidase (beta-lactamase class C family)
VTKSFTALAALKLVEQGKLELDAPVQKYLPWFQVADSQVSAQITVRNLLNHTSGLSEKGDPNSAAYTSSLEEQARLLKNVRPTASVGSKFEYYNQNYRLVGLLIETVSGQTYGDYLRDNVFAPLGMTHSVTNPADAPDLAQGYSRFFGFALPRSQRFIPGALPSGYLITTADDMACYLLAQLNNRQANGAPLLNPETLATMRTPPTGISGDYGMGWMVMENGNTLVHGGALENFQSFVALGLKEKIGFVVLYNQNSMENMLFENNTIRDGLLALLNDKTPEPTSYGWIGWLLLALTTADLLNHLRLYRMLPHWTQKTARQLRPWLWLKVLIGILFPLAVIFGLPALVNALEGGSPSWVEPFKLMPDLTVWLLTGMGLNLLRSLLHALALIRHPIPIEQ